MSVTVSPDYQITLPPEAREQLNIQPGQSLEILVYDGHLHILPVEPADAANPQESDETAYLLSQPANRRRLLEAIENVRQGRDLVEVDLAAL